MVIGASPKIDVRGVVNAGFRLWDRPRDPTMAAVCEWGFSAAYVLGSRSRRYSRLMHRKIRMRTFPSTPPAPERRGTNDPRSTSALVQPSRKAVLNDRRSTR